MYSFEDLESADSYTKKPEKPFHLIDKENETELLEWLNCELNWLKDKNKERFREIRKYRALYEGIQYRSQGLRSKEAENVNSSLKKTVINHIFDLVQNKVSKVIKYKSGITVLPQNDDMSDKIGARACETLVNHVWNKENFNGELTAQIAKTAYVDGEAYLYISWDPDQGEVHPDMITAKESGKKLKYFDEEGKETDKFIEDDVKVGDVKYEIVLTTDLLIDCKPTLKFKDAEYLFRIHIGNIYDLKKDYEKVANKITADSENASHTVNDFEKSRILNNRSDVVYYDFWHKDTKKVPEGFYCKFTKGAILEKGENKYEHGRLPFVRYTDIDFTNKVNGVSFFINLKGPNAIYNNLTNMIVRNQYLCAHPKWVFPANSVNKQDLGNDITTVQYKGPQPPQLIQQNPTPSEVFKFRDKLKEEIQQVAGIFGISRGEPPPGIEAGVALQFLSEQENERFNEIILKWSEWVRQVALVTVSVCKQFYKPEDKRTIAVLGKDNEWSTRVFDPESLDVEYDIQVQNSSALPQSKAGRMQLLMQMKKDFPNIMSDDQFIDLMDLSQNDKFVDIGAVSIKSAEMENEILLDSGELADPEEFEDHLAHWEVHLRLLRAYSFKNYGAEIKEKLKDHILATEYFIYTKMQTNPVYAQQAQGLIGFPVIFVPDLPQGPPPLAEDQAGPMTGGSGPENMPYDMNQALPSNPTFNQAEPQQTVTQ